jgi:FtsZ-binding cell division protein ZapB
MLTRHAGLRMLPILLIVAVFSAACDVPDISEFTKQSAEMTRGIRTGVKDTESLIKSASERSDLYSAKSIAKLQQNLKEYKAATKPTVDTLDALDAYLEALNALSQANKKSGENSSAAVNAVVGLVTAVSGLTFASSAVNVATGLVTLAEEFRTAKAFKKRVNLAAEIVEGKYDSVKDAAGKVILDKNGKPKLVKTCTGDVEDRVTEASGRIKKLVADATKRALAEGSPLSDDQKSALQKPQSPRQKRELLRSLGLITDGDFGQIQAAEATIGNAGCGVIDLLKFNVQDLKEINEAVSNSIYDNIRDNSGPVLTQHNQIRTRRDAIREEVTRILAVKNLVGRIGELTISSADAVVILRNKIRLKTELDDLFARDSVLKKEVLDSIRDCGRSCGRMSEVLDPPLSLACDVTCLDGFKQLLSTVNRAQSERSMGIILSILDTTKEILVTEDEKLVEDVARLKPDFDAVIAELKAVRNKRDQLDSLLTSSSSALKAWADAHANLRVAVNTKRPLTVSKLASEVRQIWAIINP